MLCRTAVRYGVSEELGPGRSYAGLAALVADTASVAATIAASAARRAAPPSWVAGSASCLNSVPLWCGDTYPARLGRVGKPPVIGV